MAPRPLWKGFLKLALVACPVALYPAFSATARVSFNTLNRATGNRLRRQMVDEETGDVVAYEDQVRGYPVAKDEYVLIEDEDLQAVEGVGPKTAQAILNWAQEQASYVEDAQAEPVEPAPQTDDTPAPSLQEDDFLAALSRAFKESEEKSRAAEQVVAEAEADAAGQAQPTPDEAEPKSQA